MAPPLVRKLPTGRLPAAPFLSSEEIRAPAGRVRAFAAPLICHCSSGSCCSPAPERGGGRGGGAPPPRWCDMSLSDGGVWRVPAVQETDRSRRIMLSGQAMEVLAATPRPVPLELAQAVGPDAYIFLNPRTGTCYGSFHIAYFKAREAAGLPESAHPRPAAHLCQSSHQRRCQPLRGAGTAGPFIGGHDPGAMAQSAAPTSSGRAPRSSAGS